MYVNTVAKQQSQEQATTYSSTCALLIVLIAVLKGPFILSSEREASPSLFGILAVNASSGSAAALALTRCGIAT
jgi:hypothetical protein